MWERGERDEVRGTQRGPGITGAGWLPCTRPCPQAAAGAGRGQIRHECARLAKAAPPRLQRPPLSECAKFKTEEPRRPRGSLPPTAAAMRAPQEANDDNAQQDHGAHAEEARLLPLGPLVVIAVVTASSAGAGAGIPRHCTRTATAYFGALAKCPPSQESADKPLGRRMGAVEVSTQTGPREMAAADYQQLSCKYFFGLGCPGRSNFLNFFGTLRLERVYIAIQTCVDGHGNSYDWPGLGVLELCFTTAKIDPA